MELLSSTPGSAKIKFQCSICVIELFAIICGSNNLCFSKRQSEDYAALTGKGLKLSKVYLSKRCKRFRCDVLSREWESGQALRG